MGIEHESSSQQDFASLSGRDFRGGGIERAGGRERACGTRKECPNGDFLKLRMVSANGSLRALGERRFSGQIRSFQDQGLWASREHFTSTGWA